MMNTNSKSIFLVMLCIIFSSLLFTGCQKDINPVGQELNDYLSEYELISINSADIFRQVEGKYNQQVEVTIDELDETFQLTDQQLLADDFSLIEIQKDGTLKTVELAERHYLHNVNMGQEEKVMLTVAADRISLHFSKENVDYLIAPISDYIGGNPTNEYVIHKISDIIIKEQQSCKSDLPVGAKLTDGAILNQNPSSRANYTVYLSGLADYSFYSHYGNANNMASYIYNNIAQASNRYAWSGLSIEILKSTLYYDPWGSYSPTYSHDTGVFWNNWVNFGAAASWLPKNDVNILWTKYMSNAGVAYEYAACKYPYWAYGIVKLQTSNSTWKHSVLAHELGHLLGAPHSNSGIMHPDTWGNTFNNTSKNQINSHVSTYWYCFQ